MKNILRILIFLAFINSGTAYAANLADTGKKVLLASLDKKHEPLFITKEANISFPEVLKGNEEQSLSYIENFSTKRRDYLIRTYTRSKKLFPKAVSILKKYDLPQELKVLLALESAFNPNAVSKAGAVGYWQIMDEVAREYNLKYVPQPCKAEKKKLAKQTPKEAAAALKALAKQKDDRKNFNKSTNMAARYLKDRCRNLNNNLLLIVASYNCGVGNVWNAMERTGKTNPDFWDIKKYLPAETQAYVMNFITLNVIFNNYDKFTARTLTFSPVNIMVPDNFEQNMIDALEEPSATAGIQ